MNYVDCRSLFVVNELHRLDPREWTETDGSSSNEQGDIQTFRRVCGRFFFEVHPVQPVSNHKENIAIIGLGRTGTAVGYLLRRAGYPIVAVASRSQASLRNGIEYTGGRVFTADADAEAASLATCIFITTPDDAIASVCCQIVKKGGVNRGDKVIHMSGACGLDLLEPARQAGALVASIHPLQSFANIEGAIQNIPSSTFGITANEDIREWSERLVRELGGIPVEVTEAIKPLYHAAACMASNYLTTLIHAVEDICLSMGMGRDDAVRAFWPLITGTLKNIENKGSVQALTGPISRGDAGTIEQHIRVFRETLPDYLPAYCAMGLLTVELARKRNSLSPERADIIKNILKRG
jgi:predicted short-subunit dehydrogenase-like oxidoreductase (DUF2520 family)